MAVESAADRLAFLSPDDFGVTATYVPAHQGATALINGIFDNEYVEVDMGGEASVASRQPVFICRTADIAATSGGGEEGDWLIIDEVSYKARDFKPDGTGMTVIVLEEQ